MNLLLPFLIFAFTSALGIGLYLAMRLKFFSDEARDLREVRWELQELQVEDFEMLLCPRSDDFVNHLWQLTPRQRREACTKRLKLTREGLHIILENAIRFEQVARFHIRRLQREGDEGAAEEKSLAYSIFDRATMCHVMAALCLGKLQMVEVRRTAWPFYMPRLAGLPVVRGHSLLAWYQHLVEDVLKLAEQDDEDWMYADILYLLTGVLALEIDEA